MRCRECGAVIEPIVRLLGTPASSREKCAYRCQCGWSYSNARAETDRVAIAPTPEDNVPFEVRAGLKHALDGALNVRNRKQKYWKFCSARSEDAVTWTVFNGLPSGATARAIGENPTGDSSLLLWGAPVRGKAKELREQLVEVSKKLGERPTSRSEPDVVIAWDDLLVVVEAKFGSPNPVQPKAAFTAYLSRLDLFSADIAAVKEAGQYELVRNWRLGAELAEALKARFVLVNLGAPSYSADVHALRRTIAETPERRATHLTWRDLLHSEPKRPEWLERYADKRGLLTQ